MLSFHRITLGTLGLARLVISFNFPYEAIQLNESETVDNPDIRFGKLPSDIKAQCKRFPDDPDWPSPERWAAFNTSLGGALVRGIPPAAACYEGIHRDDESCAVVRQRSSSALFA
jgi:hypothetical protein